MDIAGKSAAAQPQPGRTPVHTSTVLRKRILPPRVDTLICDIDNVVILFDPTVPQAIESRYNLPDGSLLDTLQQWPTAQLASVGAIDYATWLRYARQTLPPKAVDEWLAYHGRLNQPLVHLLHTVKTDGLRLILMANGTNRLHDDLTHHQIDDLAEHVCLSADIGYAKPDPRAYDHVLHHIAADPAHTLYIDDIPAWVEIAAQRGMHGHLYTGPAKLRHELAQASDHPTRNEETGAKEQTQ